MVARPFGGYVKRKIGEIDRRYERVLVAGFPVEFEGAAETLQVARDVDRTNWLTLLGICDEAIAIGWGDLLIEVPIRCTSNRAYFVSYAEAAQIIRNLRSWAAAAQANWGRLKDLARGVATRPDLDLIDLEEGWP